MLVQTASNGFVLTKTDFANHFAKLSSSDADFVKELMASCYVRTGLQPDGTMGQVTLNTEQLRDLLSFLIFCSEENYDNTKSNVKRFKHHAE
jgi:hypothetical protein